MLSHKVALGSLLLGLVSLFARFFSLILIVVLARFLTPADFGLVALAVSVMAVTQGVTDLQVISVLVQRKTLERQDIDAAFTINLLRGTVIALTMVALAWPLADLYSDPRLAPMICVLAIAPFAAGLASPMMVQFLRQVDYGPSVRNQLFSKAAMFVVAISVALATQSYWAQILGIVAAPVASTLATYVTAPYRPRLTLKGSRSILAFAGWITASRFVATVNQQGDRFFLGTLLGKDALGQYVVGSTMASNLSYGIAGPFLQTLFDGFSRIKDDAERMRRAYLRGQQVMVAFLLPLGIGLAVLARPIVELLLGQQWEMTIPIIMWLAPIVALQVLAVSVQATSMALGQPRLLVMRDLIALLLKLPATVLAAWWFGLVAAAATSASASFIMVLINLTIASRLLKIGVKQQISACWRSLSAAAVMAGALLSLLALTPDAGNGWVKLTGLIVMGGGLYSATHTLLWFAARRPDGPETFTLDLLMAGIRRLRDRKTIK